MSGISCPKGVIPDFLNKSILNQMKAKTFSWITALVFGLFMAYGCGGETKQATEAVQDAQEVVEEVATDTTLLDSMMEEVDATLEAETEGEQ